MVDAYLLGLMADTLIFNFIMVLYLMVLMHKRKGEITVIQITKIPIFNSNVQLKSAK